MILNEEQVRAVLKMEDVIPLMEKALSEFAAGHVTQPVRSVMEITKHGGFLGLMPALSDSLGVKLVTFYPPNAEKGLHTHHATIVLFKPETGEPLAIMDGRLITEVRTAASSAAATKALARDDAKVLAILGAGVQARSHLEAMKLVRDFTEVRIWSRSFEKAAALGPAVRTSEEAVRGADVICTVTGATEPVLLGAWLSPGAHINAVGACRPNSRELDETAVSRARLFVDSRAAARVEAGDVILNNGTILGEIGEVISGAAPGRTAPDQITLFKSLGLAVEDVATAQWVAEKSR